MARPQRPLAERFWLQVQKAAPDECWTWVGALRGGYGVIGVPRPGLHHQQKIVHRVSWEMHFGPIPDGLCVLHRCDNPPCVNPAHLFLGTNSDNVADMIAKGRHKHGDGMAGAVLSAVEVKEARALYSQGASLSDLSRKFNVNYETIKSAVKRFTWKSVA